MSIPDSNIISTQAADFLVYIDKSKSLILLLGLLFLSMIFIYMIYVLLTDKESKNQYSQLGRFSLLLAFIFGLLICIAFSLKNISFFMQKEPELIINKEGIKFHTLGFLPWSEIDHITPVHKGRRHSNLLKIILNSDSKWQPDAISFFSPSTFSDNSIIVEKALNVELNHLFNTLNQLKPPSRIKKRV